MAESATVRQSCAQGPVGIQVPGAVTVIGALAICMGEFALKELAASPYRTEGVAINNENGRARGQNVTAAGSALIGQRLGNSRLRRIGGDRAIGQLGNSY